MNEIYSQADMAELALCEQIQTTVEAAIPHFEKGIQIDENDRALFEDHRVQIDAAIETVQRLINEYGEVEKDTASREAGRFPEYCSFITGLFNRMPILTALKARYAALADRLPTYEDS